VTLIHEKPGLQLLKVPKTVHVTIDGPEGDTGIGPVQIDASRIRLGLNYCWLTHHQIPRPHGVRVKTIDPALLTLEGTPRCTGGSIAMMLVFSLWLMTAPVPEPIARADGQELCPVVSTRVLRDAPAICLQAGVQAKMEHLQRTLQRLRQQMERLVPQS
jgi:hypothetical protein